MRSKKQSVTVGNQNSFKALKKTFVVILAGAGRRLYLICPFFQDACKILTSLIDRFVVITDHVFLSNRGKQILAGQLLVL